MSKEMRLLRTCIFGVLLCAAELGYAEGQRYEPWRIVSAADWHSAEGGVVSKNPEAFKRKQEFEKRLIAGTVACKPDVVLIAGDVGQGHWTQGKLKRKGILKKGETIENAIYRLGDKTYRSMRENFAAAGIDRLWVCPGDHDIGDNNWPPGSEKSRCVPYHRSIFGRSFNMQDRKWLWPDVVCGVPARPKRTKYCNTSFAVLHKNVLFVMVDIFHQEGPNDRLHQRYGSIAADVKGSHLAWFERVLAAGRRDKSVRYIFVQAHTPALPPVRAQSSSMMMADRFDQSNLWQTMRRHNVDLYFAGEVHATTVSKDPKSNIVQIVTNCSSPTMITVHDDKLEFQTFTRELGEDGKPLPNPFYEEHKLTIRKEGGEIEFVGGKGVLKPIDVDAVFIHYAFEKIALTKFGTRWMDTTILNHGEFNFLYDGRAPNSRIVPGKLGNGITFDSGGTVHVHGTGPFGFFDQTERTFSIWFKTTTTGKHNLVCGDNGYKMRKWNGAGFMDLVLDDGRLVVRTSAGETTVSGPKLNDGKWHHAALVVSPKAKTLADIRVHADGEECSWIGVDGAKQPVVVKSNIYGISLAGPHRPVWKKGVLYKFDHFKGVIDDFAAWYRALSGEEIRQLYDLANTKQMNAGEVDRLFRQSRNPR